MSTLVPLKTYEKNVGSMILRDKKYCNVGGVLNNNVGIKLELKVSHT